MNLFSFHVIALCLILTGAVLHTPQNLKDFYTAFANAYGTNFQYSTAPCFNKDTASDFIDLFSELAGRSIINKNVSAAFRNMLQRDQAETVAFINNTLACIIENQETVMTFGTFDEYLISSTFMPNDLLEFFDVFPEDSYLFMSIIEYYTTKQHFNKSGLALAMVFQQTKQYQKGLLKYMKDLAHDDPVNSSQVEYSNFLKGFCKSTSTSCFYDSKLCWEFEDATCFADFLNKFTQIPTQKEGLVDNSIKFIAENFQKFRDCVDSDTWTCEHKTGDYMSFNWKYQGTFWKGFEHLDKFATSKPEELVFILNTAKRLFKRHNFEALGLVLGPVIEHGSYHIEKAVDMNAMPMDEKLLTMGYDEL